MAKRGKLRIMMGVMAITVLVFHTKLLSLTLTMTYGTFLKLQDCRGSALGCRAGNLSARKQPTDTYRRLLLKGARHSNFVLLEKMAKGNENRKAFSKKEAKVGKINQNIHNADPILKELPTTGMTFNTTLAVRCKESPYIECIPSTAREMMKKMYKISVLKRPKWQTESAMDVSLCPYNKCEMVDTIITKETDVVVVYGVRLSDNLKLPRRWGHQRYAIAVWEPPGYTRSFFNTGVETKWRNQFNLTITYRLASDIFSPYSILKFSPKPLHERPNYYEIAAKKTGTAVWIVSHCKVQSRRHIYVQEMQKYIDVDIFGRCGQRCPNVTCEDLFSNYKFYLSFENSICTDYVTEKFFKVFKPGTHVVPVVRGGADYDKYFPNFTYINAANFKTARDLALHLRKLASDLEEYSKYLEYKDLYESRIPGIDFACRLCEYLHTCTSLQTKTVNLKESLNDGQCYKPTGI